MPVDLYAMTLAGVGVPPPPPNITLPADGPAGFTSYEWGTPLPWTGFVFWSGTEWRCVCNIGPIAPMNPFNVPLVWNPVLKLYHGIFATNCGPGFSWLLQGSIDFTPRTGYARQWMHAECVEEETPGGDQWWWSLSDPRLPGSTVWTESNCGLQWTEDKVRGLVHLPTFPHTSPVLTSYVHWEP